MPSCLNVNGEFTTSIAVCPPGSAVRLLVVCFAGYYHNVVLQFISTQMEFRALFKLEGAPFAEGQFGVHVSRAVRIVDGVTVAVKAVPLPPNPIDNKKVFDALTNEYTARSRLGEHPFLVPSLGLFWEDGAAASEAHAVSTRARGLLVMGYARGGSADAHLKGTWGDAPGTSSKSTVLHVFSPAETIAVAHNLAAALAHIHAAGLYHFDVKPENILFGDAVPGMPGSRSALLGDFGSARVAKVFGKTSTRGVYAGTEAFSAPEMLMRLGAKDKADIWSLGASLLTLLTGCVLGDNDAIVSSWTGGLLRRDKDWEREAFFKSLEGTERAAWSAAPPELRDLIARCLALLPDDRPSAAELLATPLLQSEAEAQKAERERARIEDGVAVPLRHRIAALEARAAELEVCAIVCMRVLVN